MWAAVLQRIQQYVYVKFTKVQTKPLQVFKLWALKSTHNFFFKSQFQVYVILKFYTEDEKNETTINKKENGNSAHHKWVSKENNSTLLLSWNSHFQLISPSCFALASLSCLDEILVLVSSNSNNCTRGKKRRSLDAN